MCEYYTIPYHSIPYHIILSMNELSVLVPKGCLHLSLDFFSITQVRSVLGMMNHMKDESKLLWLSFLLVTIQVDFFQCQNPVFDRLLGNVSV